MLYNSSSLHLKVLVLWVLASWQLHSLLGTEPGFKLARNIFLAWLLSFLILSTKQFEFSKTWMWDIWVKHTLSTTLSISTMPIVAVVSFHWQLNWFGFTPSIDVLKMSAHAYGWTHKRMHGLQRLPIKSIVPSMMISYRQGNTNTELYLDYPVGALHP